MKKIKRMIINILEWFIYSVLSTNHRNKLITLISHKTKKRIKNLFKKGKTQTQLRRVERLKYKLRNLGFEESALQELEELYKKSQSPNMQRTIAFEIALWHANKQTEAGANLSLPYLRKAIEGEVDLVKLRQIAILQSECLLLIHKKNEARQVLQEILNNQTHPDLFLAMANTEDSPEERLNWINKVYDYYKISNVYLDEDSTLDTYDLLKHAPISIDGTSNNESPKVTVIIPVFNAEDVIHTSLQSMLAQSWRNLEILVVDDCSNDKTVSIAKEYEMKDSRLKVLQANTNGGAYIARNLALQVATGDFVTINDADDWSHPLKIETQVKHLIKNPSVVGNTSEQARATENLKFFRRGKPGLFIFSNMSSFMFRRKKVMEKIGYWDCVRFGGDSEYIKRIKNVFGEDSIVELPTGPLSFQRQSESSLTGNSSFGFPGYFMGARKEYLEAQVYYHSKAENLYYNFPMEKRPFAIPDPMLPNREYHKSKKRHFDVVIVSDFRLDGGSTLSNYEEIKAQKSLGLRTGIVQLARYDYTPKKKINSKIRELIDGDLVQMLVYGENISCKVLIVRYPPVLQERQIYYPNIEAEQVRVIVNQTPMSDYGLNGELRYDINVANQRVKEYFEKDSIWHPIGPLVRNALYRYHQEELLSIKLAKNDWMNIINLNEWEENTFRTISDSSITIGRHSRDHVVKWPNEKEELLSIYPDSSKYSVKIMGGAKTPKKVLGYIPDNWTVYEFGDMTPKEFLAEIDFFVYYTHPDWVESFGRVIIEAMAAGVPVILPRQYEELFKDAAIYAEPSKVQEVLEHMTNNPVNYNMQVEKGKKYVEEHFSYESHKKRIIDLIGEKITN